MLGIDKLPSYRARVAHDFLEMGRSWEDVGRVMGRAGEESRCTLFRPVCCKTQGGGDGGRRRSDHAKRLGCFWSSLSGAGPRVTPRGG